VVMTPESGADVHLDALRFSASRLRDIAAALTDTALTGRAYPTEWTIAQVLSHLGSGAVIMQRNVDGALVGAPTPDDFAPSVWDEWNAKTPTQQRADGLTADESLLRRLEAMTPEERDGFTLAMGPLTLGFTELVAMRLNEHALHTWDIEAAVDPAATLPRQVADLLVDNLELIARYTGKPTGDTARISVATFDPTRAFTVELAADSVTFTASASAESPDAEMPAEAFIRLIYGRLDPDHTPAQIASTAIDTLRRVFPGP
jgi:uncharacterized protein (TIGR03083 family)